MNRKLAKQRVRSLAVSDFETRTADDGTVDFSGYATTFNQPYDLGFGVMEQVAPGAFTKTLSENPDVKFLFDHAGMPMARTTASTLSLSQDDVGLRVSAKLNPNRTDVGDMVEAIRDGALTQMSFAFRILQEDYSSDGGLITIREIALDKGDVSVVTNPANENTTASVRSFRSAMQTFTVDEARSLYDECRTLGLSPENTVRMRALIGAMTDNGDAVGEERRAPVEIVDPAPAETEDLEQREAEPETAEVATTSLDLARATAEALRRK